MKESAPFLKWPGGKRWFVSKYPNLLPKEFNRYIEPFLGGGSVFFHLKPPQSILSDLNPELIATYEAIRNDWRAMNQTLLFHQKNHSGDYYYTIRESKPRTPKTKAARMIYLNRTCFNGIYRVNSCGKFNVPKGTRDSVVQEIDDFEQTSALLANAELRTSDFEPVIEQALENDFIFADPPYTVRHNVNGFLRYNEHLFTWCDQVRLADSLARAHKRGAKIVSTNANHDSIRRLYLDRGFNLQTVSRYSSISANPKSRKQFEELVISAV